MQTTGYTNPKLTRMRNKGAAKPCGPCDTDCKPCTTECAPCDTVGAGPISRPYYPPQTTPRTPPPAPGPTPAPAPAPGPTPIVVDFGQPEPTKLPVVLPVALPTQQGADSGEENNNLPGGTGNLRSGSDILGVDLVPMNLFGQSGFVAMQRQQYGSSGLPMAPGYGGTAADWEALSAEEQASVTEKLRIKAALNATSTAEQQAAAQRAQTTAGVINLIAGATNGTFDSVVTGIREGNATERARIRAAAEVQLARLRGIQNDPTSSPTDRAAAQMAAMQMQMLRDQLAAQSNTMTTVLIAGGAILGVGVLGVIGYKLMSGPKATTASSGKAIARRKR